MCAENSPYPKILDGISQIIVAGFGQEPSAEQLVSLAEDLIRNTKLFLDGDPLEDTQKLRNKWRMSAETYSNLFKGVFRQVVVEYKNQGEIELVFDALQAISAKYADVA